MAGTINIGHTTFNEKHSLPSRHQWCGGGNCEKFLTDGCMRLVSVAMGTMRTGSLSHLEASPSAFCSGLCDLNLHVLVESALAFAFYESNFCDTYSIWINFNF